MSEQRRLWVIVCAYLDERIILFIIALNSQDRIARTAGAYLHFFHLDVEEIGQILFSYFRGDAADVESTGLARKIRVSTDTHSKALHGHGGRQTSNTEDGRNLCSVGTRKVEEP